MRTDSSTLARARLAMRKAVANHLFTSNVDQIDIGLKVTGGQYVEDELAIRVHVHQKKSGVALEASVESGETKEVPDSFDGFPTDVLEGVYRPHSWWWGGWWRPARSRRAMRADPMRGGISVSDEFRAVYGTLGGLVRDRDTNDEMILSNWHVLVGRWGARMGQRIIQPGRGDGGSQVDTVATVTREAISKNLDAAVATLTGSRRLINDQLDVGSVRGVRQLGLQDIGLEVMKSGRRTDVTYGKVTGIDGVQKMTYGGLQRMVYKVMAIDPLDGFVEVSAGGDSGSWWLAKDTQEVVGLHFAGSNRPERALAIDMQSVLDALNVEIVV